MAILRAEKYLNRKAQFALVYEKGASWTDKAIVLRAVPNEHKMARYGFTVSRRVGNAVVRNRIKRLLREILGQIPLEEGWDMVFIARIAAAKLSFAEIEESVVSLLQKAGLVAGGNEDSCPGVN